MCSEYGPDPYYEVERCDYCYAALNRYGHCDYCDWEDYNDLER